MKRVTWFVGGVAAGARRRTTPRRRSRRPRRRSSGRQSLARRRQGLGTRPRVADAVREGRSDEAHRGRAQGTPRRPPHLARRARGPGDQVFVDGVPVEIGRVIVMRPKERGELAVRRCAERRRWSQRYRRCTPRARCVPIRSATEPRETRLYRHDASNMSNAAAVVVCFPSRPPTSRRSCGRRPFGCRSSRAARGPGSPGERCRPTGDRDLDVEDEPDPVGRRGQPAGVGRAGRAQPRPVEADRPPRRALRARSEQPADLLDRRQRGEQLRWTRTVWPTASPAPTSTPSRWCSRTVGHRPRRRGTRTARLRPARCVRRQRGHARRGDEGVRQLMQNPPDVATMLLDFDSTSPTAPSW
jgi:hypothetical protein